MKFLNLREEGKSLIDRFCNCDHKECHYEIIDAIFELIVKRFPKKIKVTSIGDVGFNACLSQIKEMLEQK